MNIKLPMWFNAAVVAVTLAGCVGLGWWWRGERAEGEIAVAREAAVADSVAFDSLLASTVAFYDDSLAVMEAAVETVTVRIPVAVQAERKAAATLVGYLSANEDTIGLRLFGEDEAADSSLLSLMEASYDARLALKDVEIAKRDSIIRNYDAALINVRSDLADALEARAVRDAKLPWVASFGGSIVESALIGTAAALASGDDGVGVATGLVALTVKQLPKIIRLGPQH
jgi:hypothetical protein